MSIDPQHVCYGCFTEKEPGTACPHCGFNENSERAYLAVPIGTILDGRYLIGKVLGVGGFGITYLGYDLTLDYKVAVKEYMPSGFATRADDKYTLTVTSSSQQQAYDEGLDKFLSEARTLAKFHNTPHVVSVQDFFKENNTAYFVMEYVDGESLKDYLDKNGGRVSFAAASNILMPIMEALSKVHEQGLIHRDISPDNISITSTGEPKLLDFGAARSAYADNKSVSVILKHGLAPIEQYSYHGNMGPWTDVYAMGATFYRSITGILPPESIERIHADSIKTPSSMGITIPPYAEMALMKALAVNPEGRFQTIEQFMSALKGNVSYSAPARPAAPPLVPVAQVPQQPPVYSQPVSAPVQTTAPAQTAVPNAVYSAPQPASAFGQNYAAQPARPVQPSAAPKKKGMGKGAVIGIIIGAVALVLIIVGTATAISIANNVKPTHTTKETTYNGGHFGSKETTDDTTETTERETSSKETETTRKTTAATTNGTVNTEGGTVTQLGTLKASIWVPDGYVKNEKGFYTGSNGGFSVNFTEMLKDKPVYGVGNVEEDKRFFMDYYLGKEVVETNSGRVTMPNGKSAYRIDGEYNGAKFILLAVASHTSTSKPGCYFISSWFSSDKAGSEIETAMNTFKSTGNVDSRLDDYSVNLNSKPETGTSRDVKLIFMFEPSFSSKFGSKDDIVSYINNNNDTSKNMILYSRVSSVKSQETVRNESKATFEKEFSENNNVTCKSTKTTTVTYNDIKWTVDTHDFERFTALTVTAVYPNGMVVSLHGKCTNSYKSKLNGYIKDLQRSIRLTDVS